MAGDPATILLIDSNPYDRELTLRVLRRHFANSVDVARDGQEAVDRLFGDCAPGGGVTDRPSLVLMDLRLPKIPAHEILERMRADRRMGAVPVIALTSSEFESRHIQERFGDVCCPIVKPLDLNGLADALRQSRLRWVLVQGAAVPTPAAMAACA